MGKKKGQAEGPKKSAPEVRSDIRNYIKNERDTILRKWQCLQESLNSEERRKGEFMVRQEIIKTRAIPAVVQKFIRTLKRAIRTTIAVKGGTPYSVVRSMFLYWDKDKSGELGIDELQLCMNSLGVKMEDRDVEAIIRYYDSKKGNGEMAYDKLLADIQFDEPSIIQEPPAEAESGRDEERFETQADKYTVMPPLVKQFIQAVRSVLHKKMVVEGGTELSHLRYSFLMFDHDYSSALDEEELTMAMHRNLGLCITPEQAAAVVSFYDRKGEGQMSYQLLLEDVLRGQPLMLQHPELTSRTLARTKEKLQTNPFIPKPFTPAACKTVEDFKGKIKKVLDNNIRYKGGSVRSWLRKAFISWDVTCSGVITRWQDLQAAVRKLGLNISQEEAEVIMRTYDKHSNGHMDYNLLANDILSSDPSFMTDSTSVLDLKATATSRTPADISVLIRKFRRAADVYTRKSDGSIEAKDLLHGTFIRFDSSRSGRMSVDDLKRVAREIHVSMTDAEATRLVGWFDSNGSGKLDYSLLTKQLFGDDILCRPLSLPALHASANDDPHQIKDSLKQKSLKQLSRNKLIVAERVRVQAKLESIEKQRQALLDNRRTFSGKQSSEAK